ncbi:hypothetical protein W97_03401 [Coniosporium apollinis CBS 100218]|uniref:Nop14-like protein n=1 Tax=Coniosporium apollinis (strain CBS 100218) TaxID=1168221 RepID=R7YRA9_CONA1|nr:uncharacterized protein W97_03401 [Coniosporium apollinis CBS 100218]EON64171.1 hypothetical protein W97_03401 [Coniosporium apollinis CBS 100218]
MPPSQLKRLKTSLREQGITGPQKSKKQKQRDRNGANADQRVQRTAALAGIRESFNPFEVKVLARPRKFETTTNRPTHGRQAVGRPRVTKSLGEEARKRTLLPEMNRRNKVGGILDRRIGENDPTMTPEQKMLERFTREKQRKKGASLFDLEEAEEEGQLTHLGRSLDVEDGVGGGDDFDEHSIGASDEDDDMMRPLKRRRESLEEDMDLPDAAQDGQPERKKTKAEVMKEVMAKSKLHKYERQQAKEEDDELREELDKGMPEILAALMGQRKPNPPPAIQPAPAPANADFSINPDRAALLNGMDRARADKEYDERLRQMAMDKRAAPTTRTKTEEEKIQEEAERLKELEEKRQRRMRGEEESDEEEPPQVDGLEAGDDPEGDDAAEFGFKAPPTGLRPEGVEDEDDFVIDDDLIASSSDIDAELSDDSEAEDPDDGDPHEEEEDEFVRGILSKDEENRTVLAPGASFETPRGSGLAFTYPCPTSHAELLDVFKDIPVTEVPTVVQRIRALYHPQLSAENKTKLAGFSVALVDHISHTTSNKPPTPLAVVETLIRHIHSLSRTYPETIANAFRSHLKKMHSAGSISPGDLTILTAIGSIYPTSDHFHQVVTPAITIMARWLEMTVPQTAQDHGTGAYISALCLKYQSLSKRFIPELVRFTLVALNSSTAPPDVLEIYVQNLNAMADLWSTKSAFIEVFSPDALATFKRLEQTATLRRLRILIDQARLRRRPLALHNHRPLAIKTSVPKFEEGFNPDKHYDPDRDRADAAKLRAEYKRERKGALRELRKDANFIAREKLREKKERDVAYEKKYKRLVAEIQGEEGKEANAYEREKRARKGRKG